MNSMPAASNAPDDIDRGAASVRVSPGFEMVDSHNSDASLLARSCWLQSRSARAALHCSGVITCRIFMPMTFTISKISIDL